MRLGCPILLTLVLAAGAMGCAHHRPTTRAGEEVAVVDVSASAKANRRAAELLSKEKDKEAERVIREAMKSDPNYGPLHNNLGLVYFRRNELYEAAHEFDYAARLMPTLPEPRNNLGVVYERVGRLEDAIASYTKAHELQPDNAEYVGNLVRAKARRGDTDPEMRRLLEAVLLKDSRPEWVSWAKQQLLQLDLRNKAYPGTAPAATAPTSQP